MRVGEIFGFPVYTHPDLPPGEIALVGIAGDGLEAHDVDGVLMLRRRMTVAKIVGLEEGGEDTAPGQGDFFQGGVV